jgi:hypothetical protein
VFNHEFTPLHCYKKFIHAAGDHHWSRQNIRLVRTWYIFLLSFFAFCSQIQDLFGTVGTNSIDPQGIQKWLKKFLNILKCSLCTFVYQKEHLFMYFYTFSFNIIQCWGSGPAGSACFGPPGSGPLALFS